MIRRNTGRILRNTYRIRGSTDRILQNAESVWRNTSGLRGGILTNLSEYEGLRTQYWEIGGGLIRYTERILTEYGGILTSLKTFGRWDKYWEYTTEYWEI